MRDVVIVSAARTPFGKFGGGLKTLKAVDLGGLAIKEALRRAGIQGGQVDEVIMGMVVPAGQGQIPGRQASIKGGIPHEVPVITINKVCGSALKAVSLAAQIIKAGDADILVAGGMESMSNIPYVTANMRWGARMNDVTMKDAMVLDGLWCPENNVHMAVIGGQVAGESTAEGGVCLRAGPVRMSRREDNGTFHDEHLPGGRMGWKLTARGPSSGAAGSYFRSGCQRRRRGRIGSRWSRRPLHSSPGCS